MESGVSVHTLERWRAQAMAKSARSRGWTPQKMLEALAVTSAMSDETARNNWLATHGMHWQEVSLWANAAMEGLRAFGRATRSEAKATRFRIKVLERELRNKEKTMADAAALFLDEYDEPTS